MSNTRRMLLVGGVALVKGRVRNAGPVMVEICDELEPVLQGTGYTNAAPFETLSLVIRFGKTRRLCPEYQPVDKAHSELPVSLELEMEALRCMTREQIKQEFMIATLSALIDAGQKFSLPTEKLKRRLNDSTGGPT